MTLPLFSTTEDPGPDFAGLIRRLQVPVRSTVRRPPPVSAGRRAGGNEFRHGTTVVALRFVDGIVMAGDRRATEGHIIAHRPWRRSSPPTATRPWPSPVRPAPRSRWSGCSRPSSSTTRRSRGWCSASRERPTSSARWSGSTCPWPCRAWPSSRCSPGTTWPAARAASSPTTSPGATTRRPSTTPPGPAAATPARPSSWATGSGWPATKRWSWPSSRSTRRPTRTPPPADPI